MGLNQGRHSKNYLRIGSAQNVERAKNSSKKSKDRISEFIYPKKDKLNTEYTEKIEDAPNPPKAGKKINEAPNNTIIFDDFGV